MARVYEDSHSTAWRVDAPPEVLWEYILDADAQVRHDRRIEAIVLESGAWGAVGSIMQMTGTDAAGKSHTVRVKLEASAPPHFYRTREENADVTVVSTVTTHADGQGTRVSTVTDVVTRPLNWLERLVVTRSRPRREAEAQRAAVEAQRAVEEFLAVRGQGLPGAHSEG